ncbi:hypothetical protein D3C73_1266290 [compost metagenome]
MQADLFALATDLFVAPVIAEHDQHRVADRLAGQAGARGAEGHWYALALGQLQQPDHFVFRLHAHDQLGDQPVETGVGAEGQGGRGVVETAIGGYQALGITQECGGQAHAISSPGHGVWRAACPVIQAVFLQALKRPVRVPASRG